MHERDLLLALANGPVSGNRLAREAGMTRTAIWKRIAALRDDGVDIRAWPGRGYALDVPPDLLDATAILATLPEAVRPAVARVEVAWRLDSTNSELLRRPAPDTGTAVLLAERQTGGRGRRGRRWASPLGANLYMSVARQFGGGLARLGGLSLVAGVAAVEALHGLGCTAARLKWPNDLVVDGPGGGLLKLGGLLVEGAGEHAGPARAVIGLGLNLGMPAAEGAAIDQPWADLSTCLAGVPPRNAVAGAVLACLVPALDLFDARGLAPFLPRYRAHDALAGRAVVLQAGERRETGTVTGLDRDGALLLRLADGCERRVHSGDVSVRIDGAGGARA